MQNRQVVLTKRPDGLVDSSTTAVVVGDKPVCGEGQALIRVGLLSIDPTIRTWMNDAPGYLPPIEIGAVIRGGGGGVVVESRTDAYQVGDIVIGMTGWQEWAIADASNKFSVVPKGTGLTLPIVMNVLGVTGITAFYGLTDVGAFKAGDVVVVSGAAGATGSVAGQIAKARGAKKVVGIAGGPEKCAEVVELYGFDECLDYREPHLARRLREACPKGIDVYFDNVGGEVLDAVLMNIAMHGRVVLCGAIS
ncbi:MAG: NADP-dependent oxidoreductase, partial [Actinobacteria bacterium]|nr:NADP-dependent oxidoreductase [Actinomycetota bacterium]